MPDDAGLAAPPPPPTPAATPPGTGVPLREDAGERRFPLVRLGRRVRDVLRRIAGMPDYEGYLDHWRRCHPGQPAPTRAEFFERYLESRYGAGMGRCC